MRSVISAIVKPRVNACRFMFAFPRRQTVESECATASSRMPACKHSRVTSIMDTSTPTSETNLPASIPPPSDMRYEPRPPLRYERNTVRDTWRWMWKDTLGRVLPFLGVSGVYWWLAKRDRWHVPRRLGRDLALGLAVGLPLAAISSAFRIWAIPGYRLPTLPDHAVQTSYYLVVNAPAEELFWRGTVQDLIIQGLRRVLPARVAAGLGWAVTTSAFGLYHRLGNWSWKSIAGVTAAGGVFGLMHLVKPSQAGILAPIVAHGFATTGFLNCGDVAAHAWRVLRRPR